MRKYNILLVLVIIMIYHYVTVGAVSSQLSVRRSVLPIFSVFSLDGVNYSMNIL
jgi:hypothetical protein